jgi:hypothetical protein
VGEWGGGAGWGHRCRRLVRFGWVWVAGVLPGVGWGICFVAAQLLPPTQQQTLTFSPFTHWQQRSLVWEGSQSNIAGESSVIGGQPGGQRVVKRGHHPQHKLGGLWDHGRGRLIGCRLVNNQRAGLMCVQQLSRSWPALLFHTVHAGSCRCYSHTDLSPRSLSDGPPP